MRHGGVHAVSKRRDDLAPSRVDQIRAKRGFLKVRIGDLVRVYHRYAHRIRHYRPELLDHVQSQCRPAVLWHMQVAQVWVQANPGDRRDRLPYQHGVKE